VAVNGWPKTKSRPEIWRFSGANFSFFLLLATALRGLLRSRGCYSKEISAYEKSIAEPYLSNHVVPMARLNDQPWVFGAAGAIKVT